MSVTINAKGTSVSSFAVGKNGTTITQSGTISPPASSDLIVSLDVDQNLVVDAGVSGPALITTTNSQDLHINPAVGGGGTITNASIGGSNIGTSSVALYNTTDGSPYTGSTYSVSMVANAAAGSATVLTITSVLTIVTAGTVADTYTGTYTSAVQQRNHPTQSVPTFGGSLS